MLSKICRFSMLMASVLLASCSLFGEDKIPLEGERINVLEGKSAFRSDYPSGYSITLPVMVKNNGWYQTGSNSEHKLSHLAGSENFKKKWSENFGEGLSKGEYLLPSPVVAGNVIFAMDAEAVVSAFSLDKGNKIWQKKLKPEFKTQKDISMKGAGLAVSLFQKKVFATTGLGIVYSLDMQTGKKVWKFDAEMPIRIAPTIGGGMVFVQTVDNTIITLDAQSGEEIWRYKSSGEHTVLVGGASPAYNESKDVLIVAFSTGEVMALKASTGSPLWDFFLAPKARLNSLSGINAIKSSPIIDGDVVYVAGTNNILAALNLRSGDKIWDKEIGTSNQMFLAGNYLFVLGEEFELIALNAQNGKLYWASKLSAGDDLDSKVGAFAVGPVLINEKLIVATSNGFVFAVSAQDGKVLATTNLSENIEVSPIVANGYTILTTNDADLIVYE